MPDPQQPAAPRPLKPKVLRMIDIAAPAGPVAPRAVVVLATQRCGSTLICRQLEATGLAGKPREHMLALNDAKLRRKPVPDPAGILGKGMLGDCYGLKLMAGQLDLAAALLAGPEAGRAAVADPASFARLFFQAMRGLFGDVRYVLIERQDKFAQVYSLQRARELDLFHAPAGAEQTEAKGEVGMAPRQIARKIAVLEESYRQFRSVLAAEGITAHEVTYESYVADPAAGFRGMMAHLGHDPAGVPMPDLALEKVVPTGEMEAARTRYLAGLAEVEAQKARKRARKGA